MKITKSVEKLSKWSTRFADAGSAVIINGVPYDKQTNTPVPFNTVNIIGGSTMIADSVAGHGLMTGNNIEYEFKEEADTLLSSLIDCNFESTLVDNQDSSITWSVTCSNPGNKLDGDSKSNSSACYLALDSNGNFVSTGSSICVQKIKKMENGTYEIKKSSSPISTFLNGLRVIHMTQDNDYVYIILNRRYTSSTAVSEMGLASIKLNKANLTTTTSEYNNISNCIGPMQMYGNGSYNYKMTMELRASTVIKETESGLVVLDRHLATSGNNSTSSSNAGSYFANIRGVEGNGGEQDYNWYRTIAYYYDFALNSWSIINIDGAIPFEIKYGYSLNQSTQNDYLRSSDFIRMNYAANSINTGTSVECYDVDYELTESYSSRLDHPTKCYKFVLESGDTQTITGSEVTLTFGEGVDGVTQLPVETNKFSNISSYASSYNSTITLKDYLIVRSHFYATYVTKYGSTYYLHVVYKGYNDSTDYGIYVFELDSARTTATLVSVYKPENPTLIDIRFLDTSKKKIAMVDKLGYHFLTFDTEQKKWIKNMTVNTPVNYLVFTDENTAYAINVDRSIDMIKLNAAAQVGLTPEKTSYQYSGSDVDSFVNIWAKDSDGNYVAQTVRLTIDGDAVWKSNSLQTLETTTSTEGPTAIPFTIQGETVSNIGIDVIV